MVRILGNNLPKKKKAYIALTGIYGIGLASAKKILTQLNIDLTAKLSDLTEEQLTALRNVLEASDMKLEGNLRRLVSLNIKRLVEINCRRGKRHLKGLPTRGQRTRTNAQTSRRQSLFGRKGK